MYARWVAASSNASNAPFTVKYSGGSKAISVNQRASGGQWMLLGSYAFTAGTAGSVTLTDKANGTVIADAVKVVATSGGTTSEVVRYLHSDHLNTPRLATNASAQVIWRWEGAAFGDTYPNEDVDGDGKLTTVNLRFPGQYYDAESGLHYNWNRYYDPRLGRYITSDPIGLMGGLNTYAYVENNPLRWIDPLGLCKGVWVRTRWKLNETWLPIDNISGRFTCTCYWSCKTCDGSPGGQATTDGDMFYNPSPNLRSAGRSNNDCDCDKPGQETGCCTTGKNQ